jgi:predicted branched-subunit amino acid permease
MSTIVEQPLDVAALDRLVDEAPPAPSASMARTPAAEGARSGVRDMLPITVAVLPLALVLGVATDASVVNDIAGFVSAPLIYSGSAQFALMSVLDGNGSAITAVLTALIVGVRFTMYGAALATHFRGQPGWFR